MSDHEIERLKRQVERSGGNILSELTRSHHIRLFLGLRPMIHWLRSEILSLVKGNDYEHLSDGTLLMERYPVPEHIVDTLPVLEFKVCKVWINVEVFNRGRFYNCSDALYVYPLLSYQVIPRQHAKYRPGLTTEMGNRGPRKAVIELPRTFVDSKTGEVSNNNHDNISINLLRLIWGRYLDVRRASKRL